MNLTNYGVQEMKAKEMKEINGGFWGLIALLVVIGIAVFGKDIKVS